MPRHISFMLTTAQVRARTKDVTRRLGWRTLKPGDRLVGCVQCMGLRKGQKIKRLADIEVVSVRRERLDVITPEEVRREGFPTWSPEAFIAMFCRSHRDCTPATEVTRIEFRYLED